MDNIILKKLEEEKNKYTKSLDKNFKDFSSYINETYKNNDIIFYENTINQLILYKLMKNYSAVPDMIIDFIGKQIITTLNILLDEYDKNDVILEELQYKYVEKIYGKFIPSKRMLNNIIKYTQGENICILGDKFNFLIYLLKSKGVYNIHKYKKNIKFDVLIIYEDKLNKFIFEEIKNKKNIKIIFICKNYEQNKKNIKLYDDYITKKYKNIIILSNYSKLTYFNNIVFFLKDDIDLENLKLKIDNKQEEELYYIYANNLLYLKDIGYYNEALKLILPLIKFKINKDKKNTANEIIEYLTNIYYPKLESIVENDIDDGPSLSIGLKYNYFNYEYSWSTPDSNIIKEIVDFVGDMKILEIAAGIGFWSYLFKAYGLNIISTGIKNGFHNKEHYWIKDWIEVENLTYEEAFKKYNDAEVLFLCWGTMDFNIDNFKGKYVILVAEYDGATFYIKNNNKKYKLLKEIEISHTCGIRDYLFIYKKNI